MVKVGLTKDQGLYNKPAAAVNPGALAAGTLPQYSTIQQIHFIGKQTLESTSYMFSPILVHFQGINQ